MAISKRLRYEILRRDNHTCRYCGRTAPDVKLTVDHVVPESLGGSDDPTNLVAACVDCNAGKTSSSPDSAFVADVREDALLWRQLTEAAGAQLREDRHQSTKFVNDAYAAVDAVWSSAWVIPSNAESTFEQFYRAGVRIEDVEYAAAVAATTRGVTYHWAYFCGVVWRHVRERDELAKKLYLEATGRAEGAE